jgi:repressor LexA
MLTKKQHELLLFIHKSIQETGVSPSFDEMKDALDLKSKSGIHRLITALEERGFIARLAHRARALEVLKMPGAVVPGGRKLSPNVIVGEFASATGRPTPDSSETVSLPLYGRIAAGTPIEALRDPNNFIDIPIGMLDRGEHFALEVSGDSMIEAGILDGDTAIIQRCEAADNGTIVVALVDGEEATLKKLRRKGNSVALEPANKNYETRIFPPDRVRIQGRLVAMLRRY